MLPVTNAGFSQANAVVASRGVRRINNEAVRPHTPRCFINRPSNCYKVSKPPRLGLAVAATILGFESHEKAR